MDVNQLYKSRIATPEEAVRQIKSGSRIFLTGNCSVPQRVLSALVDYAPQPRKCGDLPGVIGWTG